MHRKAALDSFGLKATLCCWERSASSLSRGNQRLRTLVQKSKHAETKPDRVCMVQPGSGMHLLWSDRLQPGRQWSIWVFFGCIEASAECCGHGSQTATVRSPIPVLRCWLAPNGPVLKALRVWRRDVSVVRLAKTNRTIAPHACSIWGARGVFA